jgi:hypothetical protein
MLSVEVAVISGSWWLETGQSTAHQSVNPHQVARVLLSRPSPNPERRSWTVPMAQSRTRPRPAWCRARRVSS